jgi:hypothetical protein
MNNDWKFRRQTFYAMNGDDFTDDLDKNEIPMIFDQDTVVVDAVNYAIAHDSVMRYPGKSYSIAIHYASWLEDFFGVNFYEVLDDPELLPDDPYFVPYSKDKGTYDEIIRILDHVNDWVIGEDQPYLKMTYQYFLQEFMLDEFGRTIFPETSDKKVQG